MSSTLLSPLSSTRQYDHFVFPGAVPRTFVGSVALGWISHIVLRIGILLGIFADKFDMQVIGEYHKVLSSSMAHVHVLPVRMVLASANAVGLIALRRGVSRRFGRPTGFMFVLLTLTQFHSPFRMAHTLPNMFALLVCSFLPPCTRFSYLKWPFPLNPQ